MPNPVSAGQSFPRPESRQFLMRLSEDVHAHGGTRPHGVTGPAGTHVPGAAAWPVCGRQPRETREGAGGVSRTRAARAAAGCGALLARRSWDPPGPRAGPHRPAQFLGGAVEVLFSLAVSNSSGLGPFRTHAPALALAGRAGGRAGGGQRAAL